MKRALQKLLGALFGIILLVVAGIGAWAWQNWQTLREPLQTDTRYYSVERGTAFSSLLEDMAANGLLERPLFVRVLARAYPELRNIKAGEFAVSPEDSSWDLLQKIRRGQVAQHAVTVPEGWSISQIAPILESAGVADPDRFRELALDPGHAKKLGVDAPSLEGYLFPDTYFFARDYGAEKVIQAMVERFYRNLPADYEARAAKFGLSVAEAITLASIVEKETGLASERKLISGVFHNRLKKGMRLQSDPTVIYGIAEFDGNIRKRDLQTTTPYNTYRINGLPPGPIANPGLESILAVVEPAPVPYLYFVSRNDGSHYFSSTLREHNNAVNLYQRAGR